MEYTVFLFVNFLYYFEEILFLYYFNKFNVERYSGIYENNNKTLHSISLKTVKTE